VKFLRNETKCVTKDNKKDNCLIVFDKYRWDKKLQSFKNYSDMIERHNDALRKAIYEAEEGIKKEI